MQYRFDDDCRGVHVWFDDAEFEKMRRDARGVGEELKAYLRELMVDRLFNAVAGVVQMGSQSDIPDMTISRRAKS